MSETRRTMWLAILIANCTRETHDILNSAFSIVAFLALTLPAMAEVWREIRR